MTGLFPRIFVTAWLTALLMVPITTLIIGGALGGDFGDALPRRVAEHVARDLADRLAGQPEEDAGAMADLVTDAYLSDFEPLFDVYVLTPGGDDLLGRAVPGEVGPLLQHGTPSRPTLATARIPVVSEGPHGYAVAVQLRLNRIAFPLIAVRAFAFLAISAIGALLLARFVVQPVLRLQQAGRRVAAGDLSVRVAHTLGRRSDEIAVLARDFDSMTERIESLLTSQQRLMRDVSHELRSPLARLQALLSLAGQDDREVDAAFVERMEGELERLDALIGQILVYSRLEARAEIVRAPTDIADLVRNIAEDASLEGVVDEKRVLVEAPSSAVVAADSGLLQSALENVIRNAVHFTPPRTVVHVVVEADDDAVSVRVEDLGPGVPEAERTRIFEPFHRIAGARQGAGDGGGVGLAIAARSIRLHGGSIVARNRTSGGLCVDVRLPRR
ncbi:MAG: ATP-binding protein [Pseudomonadales bacterium]|jgi:signal transduction histidine kinase|nr:ATP-binding protein [Pseudomonadales bacterium]